MQHPAQFNAQASEALAVLTQRVFDSRRGHADHMAAFREAIAECYILMAEADVLLAGRWC